jgi:hypothetical protein
MRYRPAWLVPKPFGGSLRARQPPFRSILLNSSVLSLHAEIEAHLVALVAWRVLVPNPNQRYENLHGPHAYTEKEYLEN